MIEKEERTALSNEQLALKLDDMENNYNQLSNDNEELKKLRM